MAFHTSNQTVVGAGGPASGPAGHAPSKGPECPDRYTETQAALHGMFMEHVGGDILDSGDAYGRIQDEWRGRGDPQAEPVVFVDRDGGETAAFRSTFHALDAALEYSDELDKRFAGFCSGADASKDWFSLAEEFAERQDKAYSWEEGMYNTYNFDNLLDSPFRWLEFDVRMADGSRRRAALVMLHRGCDIRGGYGTPRAFLLRGDMSLRQVAGEFHASCPCTQIECCGQGVVYNPDAASECEACAERRGEDEDGDEDGGGSSSVGSGADGGSGACICGEWPEHWEQTGDPNGTILCKQCGAGVEVS